MKNGSGKYMGKCECTVKFLKNFFLLSQNEYVKIVNYVQIGKDIPEIIDKLLDMGFTKEELIEYFDFDECDFLLWFIVRRNKTTKCYRN